MDCEIGYIYLREHVSYDIHNTYKLGKTSNLVDRESSYITCEIQRGKFIFVAEVELSNLDSIERKLQRHFTKIGFHVKFDGGKEFFNKNLLYDLVPFFNKNNIHHRVLSDEEINELVGKVRKTDTDSEDETDEEEIIIIPRPDQKIIVDNAYNYFQYNNKGSLILMCGVGKTLISLWISQRLNYTKILIGVPNVLLVSQWEKEVAKIFPSYKILLIKGGKTHEDIEQFLNQNASKCVVITTYSSCHKVYSVSQKLNYTFDMKINDEFHHLNSKNANLEESTETFIEMIKIPCLKQLSLTATLKILKSEDCTNQNIISNCDVEHFGEIIDKKCLLTAINEKIVCDYEIQTVITDEEQLNQFMENENKDLVEKKLFLSAFSALKSITDKNSHHLLIYSNNTENAIKICEYIEELLDNYFEIPNLYYNKYLGNMTFKEQQTTLSRFQNSKYGIISCVYCLGEGFDLPTLDGVVISENMNANIRIVQSVLRASRKNKDEPNKVAKIILPILNTVNKEFTLNEEETLFGDKQDLKKVREVIYQISLEDENILTKIKVYKLNIKPKKIKVSTDKNIEENRWKYNEELTKTLRLKTTPRHFFELSYDKIKKLLLDKNIKSKESYYQLCEVDFRLPKEPELKFKGVFDWIDYLNIKRIYYNLSICREKVKEYLSTLDYKNQHLNLSFICNELCKLDSNFPPSDLWVEYYKNDNINELKEIIIICNKKKMSGLSKV